MIYINLPVNNTRINIQIPKCQWQKLGPFDHGNCCVWELTSSIASWDDRSVFASFGCVAKSLSPSSAYTYIYITLHLQSRHNLILNWGILPFAPPNDSKVGEHNSNFTKYGLCYLQLPIISYMGFRHESCFNNFSITTGPRPSRGTSPTSRATAPWWLWPSPGCWRRRPESHGSNPQHYIDTMGIPSKNGDLMVI